MCPQLVEDSATDVISVQCMRELRIHHLRLLLILSQLSCMFLFPLWMYTDVWQIITHLHKVRTKLLGAIPLTLLQWNPLIFGSEEIL